MLCFFFLNAGKRGFFFEEYGTIIKMQKYIRLRSANMISVTVLK